jgi:hypothetical protein
MDSKFEIFEQVTLDRCKAYIVNGKQIDYNMFLQWVVIVGLNQSRRPRPKSELEHDTRLFLLHPASEVRALWFNTISVEKRATYLLGRPTFK